ncbi:MAG: 50S ribosomal protein L22 [Vampirovibrionales bacterium]
MEATARQKNIWMTARKLRRVLDMIRGKGFIEAVAILKTSPYRASELVLKKLVEAAHSAVQQQGATFQTLVVSYAVADEGPTHRRFKPRAQGRVYQRLKRTAHLTVRVKQVV